MKCLLNVGRNQSCGRSSRRVLRCQERSSQSWTVGSRRILLLQIMRLVRLQRSVFILETCLVNSSSFPCCVQSLAEDRVFEGTLHDQVVRLFCHDVMTLSQLTREIGGNYGNYSVVWVLSVSVNIYSTVLVLVCLNINGLLVCSSDSLGHALWKIAGEVGRFAVRSADGDDL